MMSLTSQLNCPLASDVISSPDVVTDALTENLLTFVISLSILKSNKVIRRIYVDKLINIYSRNPKYTFFLKIAEYIF